MAGAVSSSWDEGLGSEEAAGAADAGADGMDIEVGGDKARDPTGKKLSPAPLPELPAQLKNLQRVGRNYEGAMGASSVIFRDFVASRARRAANVFGGDEAYAAWECLLENPEVVRKVYLELCEDYDAERLPELRLHINDILVTSSAATSTPFFELRERAAYLRTLVEHGSSMSEEHLHRWDAAPYPTRESLEIDALDMLVQALPRCKGAPRSVLELAGLAEKHECNICLLRAVKLASDEQIAAGEPTVRFLFRGPCRHGLCEDCARRDAQRQLPGVARDITAAASRGELKCVVCSAAVEWPGRRSAPYIYEEADGSKGRGPLPGGASLLDSTTYLLPDALLLDLITPEKARVCDECNEFPLHVAARSGCSATAISKLIDAFPAAASEPFSGDGQLPLHSAAKISTSHEVVEALIRAHPDSLTAQDYAGRTPLLCAAGNPCIKVIESLILGPPGATFGLGKPALSIADYNGATPLSLSLANGYGAANVMRR